MNIAVIGASGRVGSHVIEEAMKRGHTVTGIARDKAKVRFSIPIIEKDIGQLQQEDLLPFDAVVDAFGVWDPAKYHLHSETVQHLCTILAGTKVRLLVVGGAGSLYTDASHTQKVYETFPKDSQALPGAMAKAMDVLVQHSDVQWTYLSPAFDFDPDGQRTGRYTLGGEEPIMNSEGESYISYADYAVAMVDEIENGAYIQKRFSVVSA